MSGKYDDMFEQYNDLMKDLDSDEEDQKEPEKKNTQILQQPKSIQQNQQSIKQLNNNQDNKNPNIQPNLEDNFAQYDKMLNDIEDEAENIEIEEIPIINQPKKPINQELVQGSIQNQYTQQNQPSYIQNQQRIQSQTVKPQQQQIPKKQSQPRAQSVQNSIIQIEQKYSPVDIIKSFVIIKKEIDYINQGLSQKNMSKDMVEFFQNKKQAIMANKSNLATKYAEAMLTPKSYLSLVEKLFQEHMSLFKQAKNENNKIALQRVSQRMQGLDQEKKQLSKDADNQFKEILKYFAPELLKIVPQKKYQSEPPKHSNNDINKNDIISRPLSSFQNNLTISSVFENDINQLPPLKQMIILKKLHKQYHNLAMYLYKYKKQEREDQLNNHYLPLLQKSKAVQDEIKNSGKSVRISDFLNTEFKELTAEHLHGMKEFEYKAALGTFIENLNNSLKEEKQIQKLASKTARMKGKLIEDSRKKIEEYEQLLKYSEALKQNQWIPIPKYEMVQSIKQISMENKDIDHTKMKIIFKRFLNCTPRSRYISFSINIDGKIYQEETSTTSSSQVLDYSIEIPIGQDRRSIWKDLPSAHIQVNVYQSRFLIGAKIKGNGNISLDDLETSNTIEGLCEIKHKQKLYQLEYGIYIREPIAKFSKKTVDTIKILQVYPEFNRMEGVEQFASEQKVKEELGQTIPQKQEVSDQEESKIQQQTQQSQQEPQQQQQLQQQQELDQPQQQNQNKEQFIVIEHDDSNKEVQILKSIDPSEYPQGVNQQEVLNPDDPAQNCVQSFLEAMIPVYEKAKLKFVQDHKRKESKFAENLYMNYYKQNMIFTNKCQSGAIDPSQYYEQLIKIRERDLNLKQFYQSKGLNTWARFVQQRIDKCDIEIQDLKENI